MGIPFITPEDYLEAEREAEFKSEYYKGEIFAMSGVSPRHNRIGTNMLAELGVALRDSPCQVFSSDMRVHIPKTGLFTYPDLSVVCGTPVFHDGDNLENPVLVVEVLSKSTQRRDRNTKFLDYQSIPSLKEYLLVSQKERSITRCTKSPDGKWQIDILDDTGMPIRLTSTGVELTFDQIYAGADSLPASR